MKIRTPNSCCTDNTWFFEYFYGFLGFVVWEISGHFGGVYQSRYCASDGAFHFSFVYVMYLNIASYFCGKQIKSKLGNTRCLWMIFICVHLKRLGLNECCTRTLKTKSYPNFQLNMSKGVEENFVKLCISYILSLKGDISPSKIDTKWRHSNLIWSTFKQSHMQNLRKVRKTVSFLYSKFKKRHNSFKNWRKVTTLVLDL